MLYCFPCSLNTKSDWFDILPFNDNSPSAYLSILVTYKATPLPPKFPIDVIWHVRLSALLIYTGSVKAKYVYELSYALFSEQIPPPV